MKKCSICKKEKTFNEFSKDKRKKFGIGNRCKICDKEKSRADRKRRKLLIVQKYGGKCMCCGENKFEFLTLDHINNDGYLHRMSISRTSGDHFYKWVVKNNFPNNLQLLCWNCNCAKGFYKICPHKTDEEKIVS